MDDKKLKELLQRYQEGSCSEEENALIESWYLKMMDKSEQNQLSEPNMTGAKHQIWEAIASKRPVRKSSTKRYYPLAAAALVFMILGVVLYFYQVDTKLPERETYAGNTEIVKPGGNKAYLTLENGERIDLSMLNDGELVEQAGVRMIKQAEGHLLYEIQPATQSNPNKLAFNKIETPVGGQYQVLLPDGTRVWLNSSSSLEYPVQFSATERKVVLRGEGYFEVEEDQSKPFRVVSRHQVVEVLGTAFNINTYDDEPEMRTTLVEGKVKLFFNEFSSLLRPGEQASIHNGVVNIQHVNVENATAWRRGDFAFNGVELNTIMRQISRWYDVEVVYQDEVGNVKFGGSISRSKNIDEVLNVLSMTQGVSFKMEGRRVLVML